MVAKKVIAICQLGGEFKTDNDGTLLYSGGDAHAMEIDEIMNYNNLKMEVAEMFSCNLNTISIKYFLPGNRKTLISISNDKDLKRMINFHGDGSTTDVYVLNEETTVLDVSHMPASRSSRTTLSEAPLSVVNDDIILDDTSQLDPLPGPIYDVVEDTSHTEPPFNPPFLDPNDEKVIKAAQQWENIITGVGQRFNGVSEFRESLRKYAIAHQFTFKYKKNDSHRVTVKCKDENCPWRIHASRLSTTQLICVKKMHPTHTCERATITTGNQATRGWVSGIIKEKMKLYPNYKPKDIINDFKDEYGIQLNYFQAWRGKEIAKEQLQGSYKDAYNQLPFFCDKIMETNPGSLATFTTKQDSSFHRLFVSFHASIYGFKNGCRPLLFLDSVPLKSKYQGMLLAATAADGSDGVFPVAFAVVDTETDENWRWFLIQLKSAMSACIRGLTFVADREKGLKESIADIFEHDEVYHAYCMRYLSEQLVRDLNGQFSHEVKRLLVEDFYAAAYAVKLEIYKRFIERIKSISAEAYNWVVQSDPTHWANVYFPGSRYNHMTSNFGELFYSWASDLHELPITQMVDAVRCKIMEFIHTRRTNSNQWPTRLTPTMEENLEKESVKIQSLQVLIISDNTFEVRGETIEFVDTEQYTCSCKLWQITGLPCCHAIAVFSCTSRDMYNYCARYFMTETYRVTYSESIHPIPDQNDFVTAGVTVTPPPTRRPPGRPSGKKFGSQEAIKRQLQCSRCKATGHNKSTCKQFLLEC
jgi:zinc finger SWIM domain-containing protein 3